MSKNSTTLPKKNLKMFWKKVRERYQNLSRKEKNESRQYGRKRNKNIPEDEKERLVNYSKKYCKNWKKGTSSANSFISLLK